MWLVKVNYRVTYTWYPLLSVSLAVFWTRMVGRAVSVIIWFTWRFGAWEEMVDETLVSKMA